MAIDPDSGVRPASAAPLSAVDQDGTYPRPQLVRRQWVDLSGRWGFSYGNRHEPADPSFSRTITVPFPPESKASGIGDTEYLPTLWYRRTISSDELRAAGLTAQTPRLLVHFGAVDWRATAWFDGQRLGSHEGGQTPFTFDLTPHLDAGVDAHELLVRVDDDPLDVEQPRGKQDWQLQPHAIWYDRTSGIWQPVWLEAVASIHVQHLTLTPDVPEAALRVAVELSERPSEPLAVTVAVDHDGMSLGAVTHHGVATRSATVTVPLRGQENGQAYEELLWSPEAPRLIGVTVTIEDATATSVDRVASYTGLRHVAATERTFWLNDRPYFLRAVLCQGFWPDTHLAAPSHVAVRDEVALIKALGFNAVRLHQKAEDPRFLFWADKLGLLVWAETANAYAFSNRAVELLVREWLDIVRRDRSHPCVVTWVPLNESWGVQHLRHSPAQRSYAAALASLTRALDPTRPVISNDGWEHVDSDIWTIHDYSPTGPELSARYDSHEELQASLDAPGREGRPVRVPGASDRGQPFVLSEFGGISFDVADTADSWGYSTAGSATEFRARLASVLAAANTARGLAGFCYTQLTDTAQETNGLCTAARQPKLPIEEIAHLVRNGPDPATPAGDPRA